jgi:hypothetical protein
MSRNNILGWRSLEPGTDQKVREKREERDED